MIKAIFRTVFLLWIVTSTGYAQDIAKSFSTAKRWAESKVYFDHRISFYCGCSYTDNKVVNQDACGYLPRRAITSSGNENIRDNRIEWEHVLPASLMGMHLQCWGSEHGQFSACIKTNGKLRSGRDCCQKVNNTFRQAHNDLVNLTPAIGEVTGEPRAYGACDFEFVNNLVEPAERIRGDIARIQLYMLGTYGESFHKTCL